MQTSIRNETPERLTPIEHGATRLRNVTGNRFPRKCSCECGREIPRDPEIRLVVDFGAPRRYPAYFREHSPDFRSYRGRARDQVDLASVPGFVPARALLAERAESKSQDEMSLRTESAHSEADASASAGAGRPWAGRPWASGQLVFNAGSFESARSGFADYAKDGETTERLRARVNRVILEDLEQKVLALRALHEKLRERIGGPSFGDVVGRSRPT